ncbi:MAG: laccase [Polaromonas sp.]|nr:laccase [Polaromonas sp.]
MPRPEVGGSVPLWPVEWDAPPGVRAAMTGRHGGVSLSPFDSCNLGDHVHDDPLHVRTNRQRLAHALGARPLFLQQVHGVEAVHLQPHTPDGTVADACFTQTPGLACAVMVADCLPVLLVDGAGRTVAAVHAGWRGLAGEGQPHGQGVLENSFESFCALSLYGNHKSAIEKDDVRWRNWAAGCQAWLGPCIGPTAFEVGDAVRAAFLATDLPRAEVDACFVPLTGVPGKFLAHLPQLARLRLARLGVGKVWGNDGSADWCTVGQADRWFSHRRDAARLGSTGRMAACIWLDGQR